MDNSNQQDVEYLKLLKIFHYVVAGMMALWGSFPIIHLLVGMGLMFGNFDQSKPDQPPLKIVGLLFALVAAAFIAVGWTLAVCTFFAGRNLARQQNYMFCLIMAGIMAAVCMPFGTILGVCTIIVLMRPSVKEAFGVPRSTEGPFASQ
jgi:hypothetical protein